MAFEKGYTPSPSSNAGKGRRKGSVNKDHGKVKEAIAKLAEDNVERMQKWLDEIAKESPAEAMKMMLALMEYNIPKLARTEMEATVNHSFEDALLDLRDGSSSEE